MLIAAEELGLVHRDGDSYHLKEQAIDLAKAEGKQRHTVFKKILVAFEPFILFITLVVKGNSMEDAARKVKVIYNIETSVKTILKVLRSWGSFAGVFLKKQGFSEVEITAEELEESYLGELQEAVQDELKARMFITSKLHAQVFSYLSVTEKDDAIMALMKYRNQPNDAVIDIGSTLESFLTRIGVDNQVDVSSATGLEKLGNALKGANLILEQHRKLCAYLAVFRNAAAHALDKVTHKPWQIEPDSAFEVILSTLTTMRSIYTYIINKGQVL